MQGIRVCVLASLHHSTTTVKNPRFSISHTQLHTHPLQTLRSIGFWTFQTIRKEILLDAATCLRQNGFCRTFSAWVIPSSAKSWANLREAFSDFCFASDQSEKQLYVAKNALYSFVVLSTHPLVVRTLDWSRARDVYDRARRRIRLSLRGSQVQACVPPKICTSSRGWDRSPISMYHVCCWAQSHTPADIKTSSWHGYDFTWQFVRFGLTPIVENLQQEEGEEVLIVERQRRFTPFHDFNCWSLLPTDPKPVTWSIKRHGNFVFAAIRGRMFATSCCRSLSCSSHNTRFLHQQNAVMSTWHPWRK